MAVSVTFVTKMLSGGDNDSFAFFFVDPWRWKKLLSLEFSSASSSPSTRVPRQFHVRFHNRFYTEAAFEGKWTDLRSSRRPAHMSLQHEASDHALSRTPQGLLPSHQLHQSARVPRLLYPQKDRHTLAPRSLTPTIHWASVKIVMEESEKLKMIQRFIPVKRLNRTDDTANKPR